LAQGAANRTGIWSCLAALAVDFRPTVTRWDVNLIAVAHNLDRSPPYPVFSEIQNRHQIRLTAKMPKASFGNLLRDARLRRGLTVAELAEQVDVSQASIYLWEPDRTRPREANLAELGRALELPIRATRQLAGL
jgi:DNA-binding XRE family transcriptional regulator